MPGPATRTRAENSPRRTEPRSHGLVDQARERNQVGPDLASPKSSRPPRPPFASPISERLAKTTAGNGFLEQKLIERKPHDDSR
jgi:hypothetical protein